MASAAERQRAWRRRHPDKAEAEIVTLRSKPRRKRVTQSVSGNVTQPDAPVTQDDGETTVTETDGVTLPVTQTMDDGHGEPQAAALAPYTVVAGLIAELALIRVALQTQGLPLAELTRLRLWADVTSRQIAAQATLQRLPKPVLGVPDPLAAYRTPPAPQKARRKAALPSRDEITPAPMSMCDTPEPESAPAPAVLDF